MITVRFPSGLALTYNDAYYVRPMTDGYRIYDKDPDKGGAMMIAMIQASTGAVLEWSRPCHVEMQPKTSDLEALAKEIRTLQRQLRKRKVGAK